MDQPSGVRLSLWSALTVVFMIAMFVGPWILALLVWGDSGNVPSRLDDLPIVAWSLGLGAPLILSIGFSIRRSTRPYGVATSIGWVVGLALFVAFGLWLNSVLE